MKQLDDFSAKVNGTIGRHAMMQLGDKVIVALSGGADSVAMFHLLWNARESLGIVVAAAHLNHGMRGQESDDDEEHVRRLCAEYSVELHTARATPPEGSKAGEEWARKERYDFLERIAAEAGAKVALGHSLSDNAETVLFNAARGSGPRGLAGIPPVRGVFVRPLLEVSRAEIEAYCAKYELRFVTDSTNKECIYARNRIRNCIMPEMEHVHPGAARSLARMAGDMREMDEWIGAQAQILLERAAQIDKQPAWCRYLPVLKDEVVCNEAGYDAKLLLQAPSPLILKAFAMLAGRDVDRAALQRMLEVLREQASAVQLPGGITARLHDGRMMLLPTAQIAELRQASDEYALGEDEYTLPLGYNFFVKLEKDPLKLDKYQKYGKKGLTFVADCAKISRNSVFRTRQTHDRVCLAGRGYAKLVKKWMNEENILSHYRAFIPLLAEGNRVLWIWGTGFSDGLEVSESTRAALVVRTARSIADANNEGV